LFHEVGRATVPNIVLDKPGPLTPGERERVRLHAYYTERVLERSAGLVRYASVASAHHERLDARATRGGPD
jgi:HD-GYP domain-containing protein (c-di-GMP phosphodiesterase class II)